MFFYRFTSGVDGAKELQKHWNSIEVLLNSMGGTSKNAREWKKCWTDLRNGTRKRYMAEKAKRGQSGVNDIVDTLSPFDQRVIGILTIEAIDGDLSREHGIANMLPNTVASSPNSFCSDEAGPSHFPEDSCEVVADSDNMNYCDVPETANESQMASSAFERESNSASRQQTSTARDPSLRGECNRSGQRFNARSSTKSRDDEETEMLRNLMTLKKRKLDILEESHEMNKREQAVRIELMQAKIKALSRQN